MEHGYIYVRNHYAYDTYNAVKIGKTLNISDRNNNYKTSEITGGYFSLIIKMSFMHIDSVESKIFKEFKNFNIKYKDGGSEFYNKDILTKIIPFISSLNIKFEIINNPESMGELLKINTIELTKGTYGIYPRNYQELIIYKSKEFYKLKNKGVLVLPCGVGKTLISLLLYKYICSPDSSKLLIAVPNLIILSQWIRIINILFYNIPYLTVYGLTSNKIINYFINNCKNNFIILTTYSSCYKIKNITFDFIILDEVHHLLNKNNKEFRKIFNIKAKKQLGLTATLKTSIFELGNIIDKKNLQWGIENEIICDYLIYPIIHTNSNKLFLTAKIALESIKNGTSNHILIYGNTTESVINIIKYINILNTEYNISNILISEYTSEINSKTQSMILNNFCRSEYGIISCIYCLGEGFDLPILDTTIFCDNMYSNVRVVQSALRAGRKNVNKPNKLMKIIIPVLKNDLVDSNKLIKIIYHMNNEDFYTLQKVKTINMELITNKLLNTKPNENTFSNYITHYIKYLETHCYKILSEIINNLDFSNNKLVININKNNKIELNIEYFSILTKYTNVDKNKINKWKYTKIFIMNILKYLELNTSYFLHKIFNIKNNTKTILNQPETNNTKYISKRIIPAVKCKIKIIKIQKLSINELILMFKDPKAKYDSKLLDYFHKNQDIIFNHYDILNSTKDDIIKKELNMRGINHQYICKLINELVILLGLNTIADTKKHFTDIEMINKLKDFIINNFTDIKEFFGVDSDGFLENESYKACKNIVNKILAYCGMKLKSECNKQTHDHRYYKLNIDYDNKFIKKIILLLK